jgi:hypothetical protein
MKSNHVKEVHIPTSVVTSLYVKRITPFRWDIPSSISIFTSLTNVHFNNQTSNPRLSTTKCSTNVYKQYKLERKRVKLCNIPHCIEK